MRLPLLLIGLLVAAIAVAVTIHQAPAAKNGSASSLAQSSGYRQTYAQVTMRAVRDFFPLGSGAGTFENIYSLYEDANVVDEWYVNHAHNDYLEVALEFGLPGMIVLLSFLTWWALQGHFLIIASRPPHFALAAWIASAAILAHSLVDYPLRTAAISSLFSLCIALLANSCFLQGIPPSAEGERRQS